MAQFCHTFHCARRYPMIHSRRENVDLHPIDALPLCQLSAVTALLGQSEHIEGKQIVRLIRNRDGLLRRKKIFVSDSAF